MTFYSGQNLSKLPTQPNDCDDGRMMFVASLNFEVHTHVFDFVSTPFIWQETDEKAKDPKLKVLKPLILTPP